VFYLLVSKTETSDMQSGIHKARAGESETEQVTLLTGNFE
jgi:hypothetical protein